MSKGASAQRPILGDSGPLQWLKKAKTGCPNPTFILSSCESVLVIDQRLHLDEMAARPSEDSCQALTGRLWRHDATSSGLPNRRFGANFSGCPERRCQFRFRIYKATGRNHVLPGGRESVILRDARDYITSLPKAEQDLEELRRRWRA